MYITILLNITMIRLINKKDYHFACKLNLIIVGLFLFILSICLISKYQENIDKNKEMHIYSGLLCISSIILINIGCFTIDKKYEMYEEI
mgnify:CR=1 FL=1